MPKGVYERTPGSKPKPREYPREIVDLVCGMYEQGMTVAEVQLAAPKGYRVQTILERYLPARRPLGKRDQRGPANHMWKGSEASYGAIHLRLGSLAGKACVDCGEAARHWSYEGGCRDELGGESCPPYCEHSEHYWPRCVRCHHHYDFKGRRATGEFLSREEVMPNVS